MSNDKTRSVLSHVACLLCKEDVNDRLHGGPQPGVVGRVEAKLLTFPPVRGIVFGNWGGGE